MATLQRGATGHDVTALQQGQPRGQRDPAERAQVAAESGRRGTRGGVLDDTTGREGVANVEDAVAFRKEQMDGRPLFMTHQLRQPIEVTGVPGTSAFGERAHMLHHRQELISFLRTQSLPKEITEKVNVVAKRAVALLPAHEDDTE